MQREGKYPLPAGASKTIMGVEFAGTVTKLGEGASRFQEGDEVFGLAYGVSEHRCEVVLSGSLVGSVCGIHHFARSHVTGEAKRTLLGPGCRATRELDDWYVDHEAIHHSLADPKSVSSAVPGRRDEGGVESSHSRCK